MITKCVISLSDYMFMSLVSCHKAEGIVEELQARRLPSQ